ncbi:hypothetical protein RFI_25905 [Reticulomyxa filosa]|uniref:Uncharacterized protein n=1 Tax=Reticulomyxa filosa TaxID=46433 RepID=X6MDH7_RETFI|nr:hypothetical protein RFI_25905 [Reticulomyxa filosa]|eukprot:ETO11472.1 hypothetical protein RFI_25905 [Reticulomyxa filosa]
MSQTETTSSGDRGKEYEKKMKEQYEGVESKASKQYNELEDKSNDRLQMEKLLKQARESLEAFMGPDVGIEKQIPITVLEKAKGIVFMTIFKAGLGVGGEMGSGVVLSRVSDGSWSPPLAIGMKKKLSFVFSFSNVQQRKKWTTVSQSFFFLSLIKKHV